MNVACNNFHHNKNCASQFSFDVTTAMLACIEHLNAYRHDSLSECGFI